MGKNSSSLVRSNITVEADKLLGEMVNASNEKGDVKVTKASLNSWILEWYRHSQFTKHIEEIRAAHFDPFRHLENVVKRMRAAKKNGDDSVDLRSELSLIESKLKNRPRKKKIKPNVEMTSGRNSQGADQPQVKTSTE